MNYSDNSELIDLTFKSIIDAKNEININADVKIPVKRFLGLCANAAATNEPTIGAKSAIYRYFSMHLTFHHL